MAIENRPPLAIKDLQDFQRCCFVLIWGLVSRIGACREIHCLRIQLNRHPGLHVSRGDEQGLHRLGMVELACH